MFNFPLIFYIPLNPLTPPSHMCIFNLNPTPAPIEYDLTFAGGEDMCLSMCSSAGNCQENQCSCTGDAIGRACGHIPTHLELKSKKNIVLSPNEFQFLRAEKEALENEEMLQFTMSAENARVFIVKSSNGRLPSPVNTLESVALQGKGVMLSFSPKLEISSFGTGDFEYLYFGKEKFFL